MRTGAASEPEQAGQRQAKRPQGAYQGKETRFIIVFKPTPQKEVTVVNEYARNVGTGVASAAALSPGESQGRRSLGGCSPWGR